MKNGKKPTEAVTDAVNAIKSNKKLSLIILISGAALLTLAVVILTFVVLGGMDFSTVAHIKFTFWPMLVSAALFALTPLFKAMSASSGYAPGDFPAKNSLSSFYVGKALDLVLPFKIGAFTDFRLYPEENGVLGKFCLFLISLFLDCVCLLVFLLIGGIAGISANNYVSGDAVFSDYWLPLFIAVFIVTALVFVVALILKPSRELLKKLVTTDRWIMTLVFSAVAWGLKFVAFYFAFAAFSNVGFLGAPAPAALATALCSLASAVPSTPAQIGLFELASVFTFVASGLTPEQGLLAGLAAHAALFVGVLAAAFVVWALFARRILKKKNDEKAAEKAAKEAEKAAETEYLPVSASDPKEPADEE